MVWSMADTSHWVTSPVLSEKWLDTIHVFSSDFLDNPSLATAFRSFLVIPELGKEAASGSYRRRCVSGGSPEIRLCKSNSTCWGFNCSFQQGLHH